MKAPGWLQALKNKADVLKRETAALELALKDPRTPRSARIVGLFTVAYALSPIDLIPDFIPVLGLLDDLLIVPAGIALTIKLIPPQVLTEARKKAAESGYKPARRPVVVVVIILIWAALLYWLVNLILGLSAGNKGRTS